MSSLENLLGVTREKLRTWMDEAVEIDNYVESIVGGRSLWQLSRDKRPYLYAVVKAISPKLAVETGVGSGVSTTFILSALQEGELHSIDMGVRYGGEGEEKVGFVVPENLRGKWHLHLGRSSEVLVPLLKQLEEIQFFLHDGEHSYQNVIFELSTAWNFMERGAIIIDNYNFTDAPRDFAKKAGVQLIQLSSTDGGLSLILKDRGPPATST